jgi:hypothetical protein
VEAVAFLNELEAALIKTEGDLLVAEKPVAAAVNKTRMQIVETDELSQEDDDGLESDVSSDSEDELIRIVN